VKGKGGAELTCYTGDGFLSGQIGHMDKGIVKRRKDVSDAENELALCDLGTE
jgi:hypothetical protein